MGRTQKYPVLYTVLWERVSIERKKIQVWAKSMTEAEIKARHLTDTDLEVVLGQPLDPLEYVKASAERLHS